MQNPLSPSILSTTVTRRIFHLDHLYSYVRIPALLQLMSRTIKPLLVNFFILQRLVLTSLMLLPSPAVICMALKLFIAKPLRTSFAICLYIPLWVCGTLTVATLFFRDFLTLIMLVIPMIVYPPVPTYFNMGTLLSHGVPRSRAQLPALLASLSTAHFPDVRAKLIGYADLCMNLVLGGSNPLLFGVIIKAVLKLLKTPSFTTKPNILKSIGILFIRK
jgi:hypothetical protein